ncbi:leucyl/phenylalanyl-tRNA--protein transferase [Bythopirellula polymerisocia]|uniref:Leucyl/phenylalanyl-tRNA--protein transferase n=1 Tax=Bythopirellula polymerisocia TaxID=2528003 RepID=A0A5C6CWP1_9BACT|nr:leucyl/phenylalanyl-tRNA--protein transferase [Bythopirellula polymerisocia]TWU28144.1 Leucyl/phenylalanyl-tRNA--protein transferase [Bythopirellula polymerisocia]
MPSKFFPNPAESSSDGLVAAGGELTPDWLLDAYRHGIFPWPMEDFEPHVWWSPDPRAVLPLDGFRASKRLLRRVRSGQFAVTFDKAFGDVMSGCASGPGREGGTWITPIMIDSYCEIHQLGHAHSVEVWRADQLIGGVYGVSIGGLFAAESMFHRERDASKVALYHLVKHLNDRGYQLLDVQQWTPHTGSLGVIEIPRHEYLGRLAEVVDLPVTFVDT